MVGGVGKRRSIDACCTAIAIAFVAPPACGGSQQDTAPEPVDAGPDTAVEDGSAGASGTLTTAEVCPELSPSEVASLESTVGSVCEWQAWRPEATGGTEGLLGADCSLDLTGVFDEDLDQMAASSQLVVVTVCEVLARTEGTLEARSWDFYGADSVVGIRFGEEICLEINSLQVEMLQVGRLCVGTELS